MVQFIPKIKRLARWKGGLPLTFETVLYLGGHSYGHLGNADNDGDDRPSDALADKMLAEVAKKMEENVIDFRPVEELADLKAQAENLAAFGIKTLFPTSIKQMSKWLGE